MVFFFLSLRWFIYLCYFFFSNPGAKEGKKRGENSSPKNHWGDFDKGGKGRLTQIIDILQGFLWGIFFFSNVLHESHLIFYSFVKLTGGKSWVFFLSFFRFLSYFPLLMHCINLLDAVIRDILERTQFFLSERMQTQ